MFRCIAALLLVTAALATPAAAQAPAPPPAAPAATVDVTVRGIEDGIRALQNMRGNQQAQQAALVLSLLRGLGRPGPVEGGRSRVDYAITVRPDGRVFVNDMDVTTVIEMANRAQRR